MDERSACYEEIKDVIARRFGELGLPVVKNIAYTTTGLVYLAGSHRGWYDRLTVSGLARVLPVKGKMKNRLKRLMRFLDNARFEINVVTPGLVRMTGYRDIIPVLVDETTAGGVEVITGSCPVEGRSIPVGFATFEKDKIPTSRNDLEDAFLSRLARVLPRGSKVVWIMDRGYARASLMRLCRKKNWLFIIRGRREVTVEYEQNGRSYRKPIRKLRCRQGQARRYRNVLYRQDGIERVDIVVYRKPGFKEPWYLVIPAGKEELLPTDKVVEWYRSRMRIEVTFRDFKAHLGLRGLSLQVRRCVRLERLLTLLAIAYVVLLSLGIGPFGQRFRARMELLRCKARHGTRRTLSVLSLALAGIFHVLLHCPGSLLPLLVQAFRRLFQRPVCVPFTAN